MITDCCYSINGNTYYANSIINVNLNIPSVKLIAVKDDIDDFQLHFLAEEQIPRCEIETFLSTVEKDQLYVLKTNKIIDYHIPENVAIQNGDYDYLNMDRFTIIDSNFTDIIGYTGSTIEELNIISMVNKSFNNYITYKHILYDKIYTVNLSYITYSDLRYGWQIFGTYSYNTWILNKKPNINKILKMHKYYIHMINHIKIISPEYNLKFMEEHVKFINNVIIDFLATENNASEVLHKKLTSLYFMNIDHIHSKQQLDMVRSTYEHKKVPELTLSNMDELEELYMSFMSYDTWYDCFKDNKCLCVLIHSEHQTKNRLKDKLCCRPVLVTNQDILGSQLIFMNTYDEYDSGIYKNKSIANSVHGSGNSGLPIYINQYHWSVAKKFVNEFISLTMDGTSYGYKKINIYIYYNVLYSLIENSFNVMTKNIILLFLNLYITIKKLNIPITKENPFDINQSIIFYMMEKSYSNIENSFEEMIKHKCQKNIYLFDKRKRSLLKDYGKNREKIIKYSTKGLCTLNTIFKLCKCSNIIDEGIEMIDELNGDITDEYISKFKNGLSMHDINIENILYTYNNKINSSFCLIDTIIQRQMLYL